MRACGVMVAVLGTGVVVGGQDAADLVEREVLPASENAALHYWRAWWAIGAKELEEASPDVAGLFSLDPDAVAHHEAPVLSETTRTLITLVENVAKLEFCDFGATAPRGVDAILFVNGHLEPVERSGAALLHDADLLLVEGDNASAADRVLACLRLIEHMARDRNETSHAVAVRMVGRCERFIAKSGTGFSGENREVIARGFERFDAGDPLYLSDVIRRSALGTERFLLAETEGGMFDPEADLEGPLHDAVAEAMEEHGSARLARASIRRDIVKTRMLGETYAELVDAAATESRFIAIGDQVRRGEFGPFAPTTFALLQEQRTRDTRARETLNRLRAWTENETVILELPEEDEE